MTQRPPAAQSGGLTASGLQLTYGGAVQALNRVDLEVSDGSIVALLGANGAGKTSLLRAISGNLRPHRASVTGTITYRGSSLMGLGPAATVRRGVVQVPEGRRIFSSLTVEENLALGGLAQPNAQARRDALDSVLDLLPLLAERRKQTAGLLSGGEQQMLAMGRAMMSGPTLLLLDEPSLGLAPKMIAAVAQIIRAINARGTSVLLIEQNASVALSLAQRAYVLALGQVVLSGPTDDPDLMDKVRHLYLGDVPEPQTGVHVDGPAAPTRKLSRWTREH